MSSLGLEAAKQIPNELWDFFLFKHFFIYVLVSYLLMLLYSSLSILQMYHPIQMKPADSENRNGKSIFSIIINLF